MFTARIKLPDTFSADDIALLSEGMDAQAHSAMREENLSGAPWVLEWMFEGRPEAADLIARISINAEIHGIIFDVPANAVSIEALPERDWLSYSYKQFPPFEAGPFFIYGSHYEDGVPDALMGLQIDAARAFGSGEHGTTKGCILAMAALKEQGLCPWNILDMGTGSGILAIAAWKLWKTPVLAVDNDAVAVDVARHHQDINGVPESGSDMICAVGDGFATPLVQEKKPYELIIANILAGPLKEMAGDLRGVMDENGYAILSGILNEQAQSVIEVYEAQGFVLRDHSEIGEWSTLILHYSGAR